jgi:multicomponent Na+:H+ antiporter subunit G
VIDFLVAALLLAGSVFFLAGTLGLLRFPDVYCRLHAVAKADNLGVGFIVAGLALEADSFVLACKLLLIWPLTLVASATVSYAIAARARELETAGSSDVVTDP